MMLSLFADAVVAALLIATISYAAVLNARLGVLRNDRVKLEELVNGLTVAAQRAEAGITGLKEVSEDGGQRLAKKIEQAQTLRDDLTYLLERGGSIADRLEGTIRARRDGTKPEPVERKREPRLDPAPRIEPRLGAASSESEETATRGLAPSRAERDLLRALSGRS
jgi:hypothetical protein